MLKQLAAGTVTVAGASALALTGRYAQAASSAPIRIGFQVHRTGIGASYGRWYDRTTKAAAKFINEMGGINGRQVEIVTEDDGTDPKRGTEVMEKFAKQHKCDVVFGTLFSHVAIATSNRAGELKDALSDRIRRPYGRRWIVEPLHTSARNHRGKKPGSGDGALCRQ